MLDIRGIDGAGVPAGVSITPSANRSSVSVTVASSTEPVDITLQYQVADSTNDPDRYVWGTISISVQDRPDAVSNLAPTGFSDKSITMRWNAGAFNNSPITNYRVTTTAGGGVVNVTNCTGTTCTIATPGNGPANAVTVSVIATNAIGDSDPYTLGSSVWSDIIPPAPTVLTSSPLNNGLRISWNAVDTPSGGSAVSSYHVTVGGVTSDPTTSVCSGSTCSIDVVDASLANGVAVSYTVSARNGAYTALSVWNTSEPQSGVPAGPPIPVASPVATATSATAISVDYAGVFSNNGKAITAYTAAVYTGGAPTCSPDGTVNANGATLSATGTATGTSFSGLAANGEYSLIVFAYNGQGCSASAVVISHTPPPVIDALGVSGPQANGAVWDFVLTGGTFADSSSVTGDYSIIYRLIGDVSAQEYPAIGIGSFFLADGNQYGHGLQVQARACRSYGAAPVCQSAWSASLSFGTPIDARLGGVHFVYDEPDELLRVNNSGTFTWLALPEGSYDAIETLCGPAPLVPESGVYTCHSDAGLLETPTLTSSVTENGQTYTVSYNGPEHL